MPLDLEAIESALTAVPGILEARVLVASRFDCAGLEGGSSLRVGYIAGPGACHSTAEDLAAAYGLDAIVVVNRLGSDAELAALPVWTRAEREQLATELAAQPGVRDVAVVPLRDGARRRPCRSRLVPDLDTQELPDTPRYPERSGLGLAISDRPALIQGRPLHRPAGYPTTLGEAFEQAAATDRGIILCAADQPRSHRRERYAALYQRSLAILGGLRGSGVSPGDIVLLDVSHAGDFIEAMWACVLGGIVFAPVAVPAAGSDPAAYARVHAAWELLGHPKLVSRATPPAMEVMNVRQLVAAPAGRPSPACDPSGTAVILLTSGSTGSPKGVHQSHAAILSMIQAAMVGGLGAGPDDVLFNWMPLDHVGAVVFSIVGPSVLGCEQVHAETSSILAAPSRWGDIISEHRVTVTWAPNFAYSLIASAAAAEERPWDLSCLRAIFNGGEAVAETALHEFLQVLRRHGVARKQVMIPSFGMSETCSACTMGTLDRARGPFSNLGPPVDGSAIRIVDEHDRDRVVREGEIGRLEIAGPQLLVRYHGQPDQERSAWFDTGDMGFIADGGLYLTGRLKDVINVNGSSWFAAEIEAAVMSTPGVDRSCVAAVPVRPPSAATDQVAVFFGVLPESGLTDDGVVLALASTIRERMLRQLGLTVEHLVPLSRAAFPRTGTGKIIRRTLTETFEAGVHDATAERVRGLCGGRGTANLPLHRRIWVPRQPVERRAAPGPAQLVFTGDDGVIRQLRRMAAGPCIQVVQAARTERLDDVTWALAPGDVAGHARVLDTLAERRGGWIVHAWGREPGDAACTSLRTLARAIAARPQGARPSLVIAVATGAVATGPADRVDLDHALVPGLCRSLGRELPDVRWRTVDLAAQERFGDVVTCELAQAAEPVVAWREGRRLVARFEAVAPSEPSAADRPVRTGDLWLVTGGLGGLGQASCAWLLGQGARVLLVGRTAPHQLPVERASALRRLAALGDVHYVAADVADGASLARAIEAREHVGRPLAGALHMAGVGRAVALADDDGAELDAMRRAALGGLRSLARIGETRPALRLLIAGSIVGQVGGRVLGYAAVHAALAEAAGALIAAGAPVSYLAFSSWSGIGLSAGQTSDAQVRSDGLVPLDAATGLVAIEAALWRPGTTWLVGLDDGHPAHAALALSTPAPLTRPIAWIQGGDAHGAIVRPDALGHPGWVLVRQAAEIPRDRAGQPDLVRLQAEDTSRRLAPRDEAERCVADIFSEVLAIEAPAIHDDFFMAGGSSLLAARLAARLSTLFFVELPAAAVFQNPTIASLTRQLRARENQRGMTDAVARHLTNLRASARQRAMGAPPLAASAQG